MTIYIIVLGVLVLIGLGLVPALLPLIGGGVDAHLRDKE